MKTLILILLLGMVLIATDIGRVVGGCVATEYAARSAQIEEAVR